VAELHQVEASKIVEYAARGSRPATCQRLGVLLERAHVPQSVLSTLKTRMEGPRPLTSLIPGPRTGHVNPRWNVLENDIGLDPSAAP
jgi:predicted transcriptional regulator of viral defense system